MAAQTEELILEINVQASIDGLAELSQTYKDLKATRDEYLQKEKQGIELTKEEKRQVEILNVGLKQTAAEYRANQRVVEGYEKAKKNEVNITNVAGNSIETNRALLKQLTEQYVKLRNPSAEATQTIRNLSNVLKEQEAAIGDTRRNVGNYKDAFVDAFREIRGLGGAVEPIKNLGLAFQSAGGGVQGFSAALATTGLPLIILGVNSLIEVFKDFKPVADAVENVTVGIGAAFKALTLGGDIEAVTKAYTEQLEVLRDLEDTQRSYDLSIQEGNNLIERNILKSKDRTLGDKERIALLESASNIEKNQLAERLARADIEIKSTEKKILSLGQLTEKERIQFEFGSAANKKAVQDILERRGVEEKDIQRFQDLLIEKARIEGESLALQQKIENRRKQLEDDIAKEREKRASADAKRREDADKQLEKLAAADLVRQQKLEEGQAKFWEQEKARELEKYNLYVQDYMQRQAALETLRTNSQMQIELQLITGETQQQIDEEYAESNYRTFEEFYRAKKKLYEGDVKAHAQAETEKVQAQKATLAASGAIADSIIGLVGQVAQAQGEGAAFAKALAFIQILTKQAVAIAGAVVGGTESGAATGPGAIGAIPAFIATLVASVTAVIGGAIGLLSEPVPTPKFAEGDEITSFLIGGKPHSAGGTKFYGEDGNVFEAEAGERAFIMKKSASDKIGLLSAWNEFWGGKSWLGPSVRYAAEGGSVTDGGYAIREASRSQDISMAIKLGIKEAFKDMPRPLVDVKEITEAQKVVERSVDVSNL